MFYFFLALHNICGGGFRADGYLKVKGFRVQGLGFRVQDLGFRIEGSGFRGKDSYWISSGLKQSTAHISHVIT